MSQAVQIVTILPLQLSAGIPSRAVPLWSGGDVVERLGHIRRELMTQIVRADEAGDLDLSCDLHDLHEQVGDCLILLGQAR